MRELCPHTGRAHRSSASPATPARASSTLVDRAGRAASRKQGKTVGVLAVDPTSPFTGGAILGDRIRMQDHALDPGVFIRSLATRGQLGGLSRATSDCARVLDAMGKDVVLDRDGRRRAGRGRDLPARAHDGGGGGARPGRRHPGDQGRHPGGRRRVRRQQGRSRGRRPHRSRPPLDAGIEPRDGEGRGGPRDRHRQVRRLARRGSLGGARDAIESHYRFLTSGPGRLQRETQRAKTELVEVLRDRLLKVALDRLAQNGARLDDLAVRIARRETDPYTVADEAARL